jgi:O-antigen/teichoic acid export membrane protein
LGKLKRLAGETVLYGFGSILPRVLNFLLVSLHTEVFPPSEYGILTKLFSYVALVNVVFLFGMETAYFRFASKPGADEKKIFNLSQTVVVCISLLCSVPFLLFSSPIADFLEVSGHEKLVRILVIIMFMDAFVAIPFSRLRLQRKPAQFAVGKLVNIALFIGLNLIFLKSSYFTPDVGYVIIANLAANSFYLLLFARTLISWRPTFDREISPQMFSYAYPVMLTGLAGMTNETFSRLMLDKWLPDNFYSNTTKAGALGIFGACYRFSVLMSLAIQAFRYAAEPFFFSQSNEKNSPQLFSKVNHYFVIVCCILLLGVSINMDILKFFLRNEEYRQGLNVVPILLLAYLFLGVYYNFSVWFKLTDRTYYGTIITVTGAAVTIAGNYFLIPVAGYTGSSYAALLCFFTMAVMCYILGQRFYPVPYTIVKDFLYVACTMAIIYIVQDIHFSSQVVAILFHAIVVMVYLGVIVMIERKGLLERQA